MEHASRTEALSPSKGAALLLRLVVLTAALVIPLVFWLRAYEVFELAKSMALCLLGTAAGVLLLWRGAPVTLRTWTGALLIFGACLVSLTRTPLLVASGERLWEVGGLILLMWAAESGVISRMRLLTCVLVAHAFVTLYGVIQFFGIDAWVPDLYVQWTSFGENRVYSTMGNPDFFSAQTSFLLPVIIGLFLGIPNPAWRILAAASFLLASPPIIYTQARGAFVGFVASALVMLYLAGRYAFRETTAKILQRVGIAVLVIAALLFATPPGRHFAGRFSEVFTDPVKSADLQVRLFYWYSGWMMGTGYHPGAATHGLAVAGSGIGAFHLAGSRAQGEAQLIWNAKWPRAADVVSPHLEMYAHNDYVHLFAEIGPVGLGLYLWAMITILTAGWRAIRSLGPGEDGERWIRIGLLSAAVSFYVNSLVNFPLKVVSNAHVFFCCLVPVLLAGSSLPRRVLVPPRPGLVRNVMLAIATLLFLAGAERLGSNILASTYMKYGHQYISANYPKQAMAFFDKSTRLNPFHKDGILLHYYNGKALQSDGRIPEAVDAFSRSIGVFPDFPEGFQARGLARLALATQEQASAPALMQGNLDQALRDLAVAHALNPKDPMTCFYEAMAYRFNHQAAESVTPFRDAILYSQDHIPDASWNLSLSLIELNRLAEARAVLEPAMVRFPGSLPPNAKAVLTSLKAGHRPAAPPKVSHVPSISPPPPGMHAVPVKTKTQPPPGELDVR